LISDGATNSWTVELYLCCILPSNPKYTAMSPVLVTYKS
jgi:hypothetical protein